MGRTALAVIDLGSSEIWTKTIPDLPPLGGRPVLGLLAAMAVEVCGDLPANEFVGLQYEYLGEDDPVFRVGRTLSMGDARQIAQGSPIVPLAGEATESGGLYDGWLICSEGWLMDPEARG